MDSAEYHNTVILLTPDGEEETADFAYWRTDEFHLRVRSPSLPVYEFADTDLFLCVAQLRNEIEPRGWRVLCNAARLNASFSSMLRDTRSVLVYLHPVDGDGQVSRQAVHVLGAAKREEVGSLYEQSRRLEELLGLEPGSLPSY